MIKYQKKATLSLFITLLITSIGFSLQATEEPKRPAFIENMKSFKDLSIKQLIELISYYKSNLQHYSSREENHPDGRLLRKKELLKSDKKEKVYENSLLAMRRYIKLLKSANLSSRDRSRFWLSRPSIYHARTTLFGKQIDQLKQQGTDPEIINTVELLHTQIDKNALPREIDNTALNLSDIELSGGRKFKINDEYTAKEIYRLIKKGKKETEYNGQFSDKIKEYLIKEKQDLLDKLIEENGKITIEALKEKMASEDVILEKYENEIIVKDITRKVSLLDATRYLSHIKEKLHKILTKELGESKVEASLNTDIE